MLITRPVKVVNHNLTKSDIVKIIDEKLYEQKTADYAPLKHQHSITDIQDITDVRRGLSRDDHKHDVKEIVGIEKFVDSKISAIPKPRVDVKKHTHTVSEIEGDIPLHRVEGAEEIKAKAEREWAEKGHSHKDLESSIARLQRALGRIKIPNYDNEIKAMQKEIEILKNYEPEKPVIPPEEIIFNSYALTPDRAHGKNVTKVETLDFDGEPVNAKVSVKVGYSLKKGEVISVFPSCICHVVAE